MKAVVALDDEALVQLAEALESGRLALPVSEFGLRRVLGRNVSADLVSAIQALLLHGPAAAGAALRLARDARSTRIGTEPELVWTGEDAIDTLRETSVVVGELFRRAERDVVLSGFVVRSGAEVFEVLGHRMEERPELQVQLFLNVGLDEGRSAEESILSFARRFREREWPGKRPPVVFYDPRALRADFKERAVLHAKCIVVDRRHALVTSANFTPNAQLKNIELGVLLDAPALAVQIIGQFEGLVREGKLLRLP
jgi:phosphatidylserine/phosphatidylglycerophosphate/cardiolipin synthase-like enzyme